MCGESDLPEDVIAAIRANRTIDAIKLVRQHTGLGLKEAKDIVDAYVASNPSAVIGAPRAESGGGRLLLAGVLAAAAYAAYRLLT